MKIGDTIISRGGEKYSIDSFVSIKNESGVNLKSLNGSDESFIIMKSYLNYYIGTGIYIIKRKNNIMKTVTPKKLRRRLNSHKLRDKKS